MRLNKKVSKNKNKCCQYVVTYVTYRQDVYVNKITISFVFPNLLETSFFMFLNGILAYYNSDCSIKFPGSIIFLPITYTIENIGQGESCIINSNTRRTLLFLVYFPLMLCFSFLIGT